MKRLYTITILLLGFLVGFGQTIPFQAVGNSGNEYRIIGIGSANKGFMLRNSYTDTTEMNTDQWLKYQRGIQVRSGDTIWQRSHDLTHWFRTGAGSVITDESSTVSFIGDGSSGSPLTADVIISEQQGNAIESTGQGLFVRNFVQDGIIEPGVITWIQNYDYDVSPAVGVIGGIEYTTPWTPITLANSDPTFDRIDVVVFNAGVGSSDGTITVITGTPAADPQQPTVDPDTQLAMAFILVTANTTAPPTPPTQDWIYINNNEWTTVSSSATIDPASILFPYSVPLDIRGLAAGNGDNIVFTSITPPTISNFNVLTFKIRSGSIWAANSRIELQWYSGATPIGNVVSLSNGTFGFNSGQLFTYQIASIPLPNFGPLANVTALRMNVRTTGNRTIGFYIDDIQLQGAIIPPTGGLGSVGLSMPSAFTVTNSPLTSSGTLTVTGAGTTAQYIRGDGTLATFPSAISTADNGLTTNTSTNVQLGGSLIQNTLINNGPYKIEFTSSFTGSPNYGYYFTNTSGYGIRSTATAYPIAGFSSGGSVFYGSNSTNGTILQGDGTTSGTNNVVPLVILTRATSGTPSAGIGASIELWLEHSNGGNSPSNTIVSKWTDETQVSLTSQFIITGVNSAVTADLFTLSGSGATRLNKYGVNTFAGTPTFAIGTDASGNLVEFAVGGGTYTASNGLTMTANNTKLGGSLIENTTITSSTFISTFTGANTSGSNGIITVTNSSTGNAIAATNNGGSATLNVQNSSSGNGATITSSSGNGVSASSTTGIAGRFRVNPATTNTTHNVLEVIRGTTGTGANGIAGGIRLMAETATGDDREAAQIVWSFTDAADATRTGDLQFFTTNSAVSAIKATLAGSGAWRYHAYGTGAITGTAAFGAAWDASGNLIEIALGGGGGGTVNSVGGTLNRITSTGGTDPILDISASYVGQASITTLGTIATGTWEGTAIGDTYISSASTWNAKQAGDATLTALAGLTITNGSIIYGTGADAFSVLAAGSEGQALIMTSGTPTWTTLGVGGTLTNITGVNTNGFSWSIANPTTTPALTLGTSITGILKGNGTAISAAVAGTDYLTPSGNTTGSAATLTTPRNINGVAFNGSADITVTAAASTLTGATLASNVLSSSLTSVGTIGTGTWQGTAIGLGFGGTGLTSGGTANQILGMNAAGNASQYKTLSGANGIEVTHSVGGVAISNVFNPTVQTLTDGATVTWNVTNGGNATVTLAGTGRTLTITNPVAGYTYTIRVIQGSGGSKTITTWPTNTKWPNGVAPTLSTAAGDYDVIVLFYDGTNYYGTYQNDFS